MNGSSVAKRWYNLGQYVVRESCPVARIVVVFVNKQTCHMLLLTRITAAHTPADGARFNSCRSFNCTANDGRHDDDAVECIRSSAYGASGRSSRSMRLCGLSGDYK